MAAPILPPVTTAIGLGTATLSSLRPTAAQFVTASSKGVYWHIFEGWKAQLKLLRRRQADEVACVRLDLATGEALRELVASEYFASLTSEPQKAIGTVTLRRTTTAAGGNVIKQGTKFALRANPTASPPVQDAAYVSSAPVVVRANALSVTVPIVAVSSGVAGNIPRYANGQSPAIALDDTLFDPSFTTTVSDAAGGSSGTTDVDLRRYAKALYAGQWVPTDAAILAGAYSDAGVKHAHVIEDTSTGQALLFVADESWATSEAFRSRVKRLLREHPWVGFGCRVDVRPIVNQLVAVNATIMLADPKYQDAMADIAEVCRKAVRAYLDERRDWYTFNTNAIGGVLARADSRILTCATASVVDRATGATIELQPPSASLTHFYLSDNGLNLTVDGPS